MQPAANVLFRYQEQIISEWKKTFDNQSGVKDLKMQYSERDQSLYGSFTLNGELNNVCYSSDEEETPQKALELLRDEINVDFAMIFYNALPKDKKQTELNINIAENRFPRLLSMTVSNNATPKTTYFCDVFYKRVYDVATATLNIGTIERIYDRALEQKKETCSLINYYEKDEPIVEETPTDSRPENLIQMPRVELGFKL